MPKIKLKQETESTKRVYSERWKAGVSYSRCGHILIVEIQRAYIRMIVVKLKIYSLTFSCSFTTYFFVKQYYAILHTLFKLLKGIYKMIINFNDSKLPYFFEKKDSSASCQMTKMYRS